MRIAEPTVMIVDDYDDTRELLRTLLELKGCRVVEARNGWEAVDLFPVTNPGLVLMDLEMPVLNGFEATRLILEMRRVPVVAVSAQFEHERRRRAVEAGCVECYQKPVDIELIGNLIDRYFPDTAL